MRLFSLQNIINENYLYDKNVTLEMVLLNEIQTIVEEVSIDPSPRQFLS